MPCWNRCRSARRLAPPVIPDRVDLQSEQAEVHISDIYAGEGMQGVPRGTVKKLRVYEPHFAYPGMGGHINIGIDGPWDVRRIWGTVPVDSDGSVNFMAPANTPLAVQPLDDDGRAVAVMRSWFAAMPGEVVSCTGCHESQNRAPLGRPRLAVLREPSQIEPWYGPPRGMSFQREVQPVLGQVLRRLPPRRAVRSARPASRRREPLPQLHAVVRGPAPRSFAGPVRKATITCRSRWNGTPARASWCRCWRRGTTTCKLDREGWDRLITWIDLNVPDRGTWQEQAGTRARHAAAPGNAQAAMRTGRTTPRRSCPRFSRARLSKVCRLTAAPWRLSPRRRRPRAMRGRRG